MMVLEERGSGKSSPIPDVLLYDVHYLWLIVPTRQKIVGLGNPSVASHCLVMGVLEQV